MKNCKLLKRLTLFGRVYYLYSCEVAMTVQCALLPEGYGISLENLADFGITRNLALFLMFDSTSKSKND